MLFDICTSLFGIMNQYDPTVDLKVNVGRCDLYFHSPLIFMLHFEDILMYYYHILGLCDLYFISL